MSRRTDPNSQYKVAIHAINGYRYASTQPFQIDTETGKKVYRRVHWGTVDDSNKFIPGKNYLTAAPEDRGKLIFPDSWDLSEIKKLSGNREKGRPAIESQDENRLYGDIWLLEQIAEVTGIRKDLMKTFHNNEETVNAIMTMAMFLFTGKGTYNQLAAWQRITKAPCDRELTSPYITKFTQSITETDRMNLLRLRAARLGNEELCAVDSTSRSAWGDSLPDIRYGKNKDRLEAGFFANTTHGLDIDDMTAQRHYSLRDEQEKYFSMMKGILGADRQRNSSELGKEGRLFVLFVAQIMGCYLANVRKEKLADKYHSIQDVLNEMRPIRFIEHPGTKPFITPFIGKQIEICDAFGFDIPDGCSPEYAVRRTNKGKPGRPRKNRLVVKDS